ncbi:hypothetical protein EVAR_17406_1 [Eumeta japonica]|uniref:Uncharacterized protein n=1 Tax=Eumeta variegata TaxID=151549 RepID=A0A4C1VD49_EUMVA|nr:hypothetical protein EVAR_17406_1 [Eumeta japonica]
MCTYLSKFGTHVELFSEATTFSVRHKAKDLAARRRGARGAPHAADCDPSNVAFQWCSAPGGVGQRSTGSSSDCSVLGSNPNHEPSDR